MINKNLKVAVLGAGAMGCLFGGLLAEKGLNVILIDVWKEHVEAINKNGLKSNRVNKVYEGSPHVVNFMQEKKIDLVINTTQGRQAITDSFSLRRAALTNDIPYFTTIVAAQNAILSIKSLLKEELQVKPLQHYY